MSVRAFWSILACFVLALSLAACGGDDDTKDDAKKDKDSGSKSSSTDDAADEEAAEEEGEALSVADLEAGASDAAAAFFAAYEEGDYETACSSYDEEGDAGLVKTAAEAGIEGETCTDVLPQYEAMAPGLVSEVTGATADEDAQTVVVTNKQTAADGQTNDGDQTWGYVDGSWLIAADN